MAVETSSDSEPTPSATSQAEQKKEMPPTRTFIAPPPQPNVTTNRSFALSASSLPTCAWVCVVFFPILWLLGVLSSGRPLYHIFFTFLSLVPTLIVARFVLKTFADEAVSKSFLFSQFLLSALPLTFVILLVQILLFGIFSVILFASDIQNVGEALINGEQLSRIGFHAMRAVTRTPILSDQKLSGDSATPDILDAFLKQIPLWKLLLSALFMALFVAGVTEEVGKWTLARRYKLVNGLQQNIENERGIGCRGILSIACMGALGFASVENYWSVVGLTASPETAFQLAFVGLALFRGLLAIPVHVGAQFYVAVAAAQWYVFHEPLSVMGSLFLAVLFHGVFDAIALVAVTLTSKGVVSSWVGVCVPVLQVCLTVSLLLLCRGRYKALLERERLVLMSCDAV